MVSANFTFRKRKSPEFIELEQLSLAEKPGFLWNSLQYASQNLRCQFCRGAFHPCWWSDIALAIDVEYRVNQRNLFLAAA
jgi:hypothetical protein